MGYLSMNPPPLLLGGSRFWWVCGLSPGLRLVAPVLGETEGSSGGDAPSAGSSRASSREDGLGASALQTSCKVSFSPPGYFSSSSGSLEASKLKSRASSEWVTTTIATLLRLEAESLLLIFPSSRGSGHGWWRKKADAYNITDGVGKVHQMVLFIQPS